MTQTKMKKNEHHPIDGHGAFVCVRAVMFLDPTLPPMRPTTRHHASVPSPCQELRNPEKNIPKDAKPTICPKHPYETRRETGKKRKKKRRNAAGRFVWGGATVKGEMRPWSVVWCGLDVVSVALSLALPCVCVCVCDFLMGARHVRPVSCMRRAYYIYRKREERGGLRVRFESIFFFTVRRRRQRPQRS